MIAYIKGWFYRKYGIELESRHVWLGLALIFSLVVMSVSLINNRNVIFSTKPEMTKATNQPPVRK